MLAITALFALIVVVCVVYFAIAYRDDAEDKDGARIPGAMQLELGWSLIPFFVATSIFVWASIALVRIGRGP